MVIILLKLVVLASALLLSTLSDIRTGIIKNKYIVFAIILGAILNFVTFFYETSFIKYQLINILVVNIISVFLYVFHAWAGGDCKLVFAVSLLVPYELYFSFINPYFSLLLLMAFIFVFSYLFLIYDSIKSAVLKKYIFNPNEVFKKLKCYIKTYLCNLIYIVFVDQLLIILFERIVNNFPYLLLIVNACLVILLFSVKLLKNKYLVCIVLFFDVVLSIVFSITILSYMMLLNYLIACLITLLRFFIDEFNYEIIPTKNVKSGMILSLNTTILFTNSRVKGLPKLSSETLNSRLTNDEAQSVLRWEKSKYGKSEIQIVRKIPFAIFISLGTVLFIVLGVITK